MILGGMIFFILIESISGFFRWFCSELRFIEIIYIPKLVLVLCFLYLVLLHKHHVSKWFVLLFIIISCTLGIFLNGTEESLFTLFMIFPFLAFYFMNFNSSESSFKFYCLLMVIYVITISGIIYDYFYEVPWTGSYLETGYGELKNSREWWTQGFTRSAGFTRESTTAAMLTGLLTIMLVSLSSRRLHKLVILLLSFFAIVLTTSKSSAFGLLLILPLIFNPSSLVGLIYFNLIIFVQLSVLLIAAVASITGYFRPTDVTEVLLYGSFYNRLTETWPDYLSKILNSFSYDGLALIFGGGMGSTGAPQKIFSNTVALADSSFLYLWGTFGIAGIFFWFYILRNIRHLLLERSSFFQGIAISGFFVMILSITTDIWESPFALVVIGICLAISRKRLDAKTNLKKANNL